VAAERHGRDAPGRLDDAEPEVRRKSARHTVGAGQDVRPQVQPVRPAGERPNTTAETVIGLQEENVAVAQFPGGGQAGEPATDDDDLVPVRLVESLRRRFRPACRCRSATR
jgi:hypothetical protein